MKKTDKDLARHRAHFGPISQGLIDFVTNDVLLGSRYLFTRSAKGIQSAYCTHCKQTHYPDSKLKHGTTAKCPNCKSKCRIYMGHVGRKYLKDDAYVVYYQKSIIDPQIVTAMGFYVRRDYSGDYTNVETLYRPSCSYVFQMGDSEMYQGSYYNDDHWFKKKSVTSEFSFYHSIKKRYCRESIRIAVEGTPLQYSTWEKYDEQDLTKFFAMYTKYPCIEYLTKMGYSYFVLAKLYGQRTFDAIRWSGRSMDQVLRLKLKDFRQFMEACPSIGRGYEDRALAFRLYQMTLRDNDRPSIPELLNVARRVGGVWNEIKPMFKYQTVMKCIQYVDRQLKNGKKRYRDVLAVLDTWRDYMKQCKQLGYNLSHLDVVFPINLSAAHDRATSQVKIMLSELEKRKIAQRLKELEPYRFSHEGYFIRAAQSAQEIITEGKKLRHCVGGYAQSHANGETNILVIRKAGDPDEPFYTLELKDGKIRQVYGYRHALPKADVQAFVDAFRQAKLIKKPRTNNKPSERQEVAV